jgi:hypothetical protein
LPTYRTSSGSLLLAVGIGFAIALVAGIVWGYAPQWNFYLTLILGFGVAEGMAWAAKGKRGVDLQAVGFIAIAAGLIIGRVILANRLGISWQDVQDSRRGVDDALYLDFIPDGLFAIMALAIVWYRFR